MGTFKSAQKSAKKSVFANKSAQKSTLKGTFGSSDPIWYIWLAAELNMRWYRLDALHRNLNILFILTIIICGLMIAVKYLFWNVIFSN